MGLEVEAEKWKYIFRFAAVRYYCASTSDREFINHLSIRNDEIDPL